MNTQQPQTPQQPQLNTFTKIQMKFSNARMLIGSVVGVIAFVIVCIQVYRTQGFSALGQTIFSWLGIRMY